MQKAISLLLILGVGYFLLNDTDIVDRFTDEPSLANSVIIDAFNSGKSDLQAGGSGKVVRVLPDDNTGSRHQRFILRIPSGQTLLMAHNIDLAPRIAGLSEGDDVEFYGEYEWNDRGGVIHWTHHDPQGRHADGWLKHRGRIYQ